MIRTINPWTPAFVFDRPKMGQQDAPLTPLVSPAKPASFGMKAGAGALVLGLSSVGVLFTYGIARDSRSSLVKTTGYIMAGAGALVALGEAWAVVKALSN